jgi:hypothetical protein
MPNQKSGPYPLSHVLREEFQEIGWAKRIQEAQDAVRGAKLGVEQARAALATGGEAAEKDLKRAEQALEKAVAAVNAIERLKSLSPIASTSELTDEKETERRQTVYQAAHALKFSALCLSGGGIRSASFSLGVIQALAEATLLGKFKYLSTVSGGGYIGSWLSAWLHWDRSIGGNGGKVLQDLRPQRAVSDEEPPPIRHLRQYSSYLTPKVGLLSGDFWAAIAIVVRNLLLNWLILVPLIALPIIAVKATAALVYTASYLWWALLVGLLFSLLCGGLSFGYKLNRLYLLRPGRQPGLEQSGFLKWSLAPALVAGLFFSWMIDRAGPADCSATTWEWACFDGSGRPGWPMFVVAALIVYTIVKVVVCLQVAKARRVADDATPPKEVIPNTPPEEVIPNWRDWVSWTAGAIAWGTLIWFGTYLYAALPAPYEIVRFGTVCLKEVTSCAKTTVPHAIEVDRHRLLVISGIPWFLLSIMLAQTVYTLGRSYSPAGDFEREWLGRAGGWYMITAFGWIVLSATVLLGPDLFNSAHLLVDNGGTWLTALGTASGAMTAFLGRSSLTSAQGANTSRYGTISNIALAVAGPIFGFVLLILFSVVFDKLAFGHPLSETPLINPSAANPEYWTDVGWGLGIVGGLIIVMLVADLLMNVNRFSLHAVYRNRLVRAYLGGPRTIPELPQHDKRKPDGFTGFDQNDNIRMTALWPKNREGDGAWCPFHVINMALNLPATENLAWQQRKATSFTVTPLFCGAADYRFSCPETRALGYRNTGDYGNPGGGISLGTAMAISGAAASSNMGYHSSPSISFLLTLLNVRLGWWLGNPGPAGERQHNWTYRIKRLLSPSNHSFVPYAQDAPWFSIRPLASELFGWMNEESRYIYLSDGGHFENLGLYEMIRRRCKWIVVVDGDADPGRGFIDLGDAVRKVWIDLGVRIQFRDSDLLQATRDSKPEEVPYFALGTIEYVSDATGPNPPCGHILYLKPTVRGDEWAADIIAYQRANPDFPHQSTGDQWFDEPQLEAYRALGYLTMHRILEALPKPPLDLDDLFSKLRGLNPRTFGPRTPPDDT